MKSYVINLGVSAFSTLLLLFIIELVIRLVSPQDLSGVWLTLSKNGYTLNKELISVQHAHRISNRLVTYRFNQQHLRGGKIKKTAYKILAVGDSFTFGWLLDEKNTYLRLLQNECDAAFGKEQIQVLNGGTGGWGLAHCLDYIQEFGDQVNPQMIVVYFNGDDLARSLYKYTHNASSLSNRAKEFIKYLSIYQWMLQNSHLLQWVRVRLNTMNLIGLAITSIPKNMQSIEIPKTMLEEEEHTKKAVRLGKELFRQINSWCVKRNIPLVVLTTGWHFDLYDKENSKDPGPLFLKDPEVAFLNEAEDFFKYYKIPFYDLTPDVKSQLKNEAQNYVIKSDGHPNEKGAALIAKYSWQKLYPIIGRHYQKN